VVKRDRAVPQVSVRALLALGSLLGHYVLASAILAALAVVDLVFFRSSQTVTLGALQAYTGSLAIAWSVVRVVVLARRGERGLVAGLSLKPDAQPELWGRIRELAAQAGTRPPAEVRVVPQAGAMVQQDARLFGLIPGRRRLFIGVPLLMGLSEGELDAVLAHELGHYANGDVRLAGLVWAARDRLLRTVRALNQRADAYEAREVADFVERTARRRAAGKPPPVERKPSHGPDHYLGKVFTAYAKLCLRATESVSRRQEFAADRVAARVAGRDTTVAALRRIPALEAAHHHYLDHYATMGWDADLLPPAGQFYGGLAHLLADEARRRELSELEWELPPEELSPYDSHPSTADRIAALEALSDDGRGAGPDSLRRPAWSLREPAEVFADLERATLDALAPSMQRVAWEELPLRTRRAAHARDAQPLLDAMALVAAARGIGTGGRPDLGVLLDMVDHGLLHDIADRLPKSEQAARSSGRAAREFGRSAFRSALRHLSVLALVDTGMIGWELSWAGPSVRQVVSDGLSDALTPALDAVVADPPDTAPLRTLLNAPVSRGTWTPRGPGAGGCASSPSPSVPSQAQPPTSQSPQGLI